MVTIFCSQTFSVGDFNCRCTKITVESQTHDTLTEVRSCVSYGLFNFSLCPPGDWARASILNHLGIFKDASSIKCVIQIYLLVQKKQ